MLFSLYIKNSRLDNATETIKKENGPAPLLDISQYVLRMESAFHLHLMEDQLKLYLYYCKVAISRISIYRRFLLQSLKI